MEKGLGAEDDGVRGGETAFSCLLLLHHVLLLVAGAVLVFCRACAWPQQGTPGRLLLLPRTELRVQCETQHIIDTCEPSLFLYDNLEKRTTMPLLNRCATASTPLPSVKQHEEVPSCCLCLCCRSLGPTSRAKDGYSFRRRRWWCSLLGRLAVIYSTMHT